MDYIDYPSPKSADEAKAHLEKGGELWIKYFDEDCPDEECEDKLHCNCCYGAFLEDFEEDGMIANPNEDYLKRMHLVNPDN